MDLSGTNSNERTFFPHERVIYDGELYYFSYYSSTTRHPENAGMGVVYRLCNRHGKDVIVVKIADLKREL